MTMSDRQVKIVIAADVAAALRGLQQVEQGLGRVGEQGNSAGQGTTSFMDKLQTGLAIVGVQTGFDAIVSGFKAVVGSGMEYEQNMNMLQAVSGASGAEMAEVGALAKQLGNDLTLPGASAQSAAAAMTELAKGGLTLDESMSAVRGTLILAAAAQIDGAQAAEIQSAALNTFGLAASDADRVANVLANTANASSGEITDFAQGMAQAGGVANMFGVSIEDTSTVLGLFANAGMKGSDAGTSLKTALLAMLDPTVKQQSAIETLGLKIFDAQGNFVGMRSVTADLSAAQQNLTQETFNTAAAQIFGSDAVRAAGGIAQAGAEGYDEMAAAVTRAGGAQEVAAANAKGLTGAVDAFANAAQTAGLSLYENFAPALEDIVGFATDALGVLSGFADWFSDLPGPVQGAAIALGVVVALRGPLTAAFASMMTQGTLLLATLRGTAGAAAAGSAGLAGYIASLRAASGAAATFGVVARGALAVLGGPIGLAIIGVTTALAFMSSGTDEAAAATETLSGAIDEQTGKLTENAAAIISKSVADSGQGAAYERLGGNVADYVDAIGGIPGAQERVNAVIADAQARYDAYQDSVGKATTGTGNFGTGAAAAADDTGKLAPRIDDVNLAAQGLEAGTSKMASEIETARINAQGLGGELGSTEGALEGTGAAAADAADPIKEYSDALQAAIDHAKVMAENTGLESTLSGAATAANSLSSAMDFLSIKFAEIAGRNVSAEEAAAALNAAYRGVEDALKDGTAAATENSEAGQLNTEALKNWDVAALTATDDGAKMYDALNNLVDAHGQTTASAYLDAIATGDVAGANDKARAAAQLSRDQFVRLAGQYGLTTDEANILANELGVLDAQQIDDKVFETILEDQVAKGKLTELQAQQIRDKQFGVTAVDNASATLSRIASYTIGDKTFTIRQINETQYRTATGQIAEADGGVLSPMANGGMLHAAAGLVTGRGQSQVRQGFGDGVTWAEGITGKEYYLSMKKGMEDRNRGLASMAVADLGGQAVWGRPDVRAGSFTPPTPQRVIVELHGEGITAEMVRTATVTVNGALVEVAAGLNRAQGQS
jgi:TP901 family phage tail tape measure protein